MRNSILCLMLLCATACFAEDQAPQWLIDAAAKPVPKYTGNVPAVVLIDEADVSLGATGSRVTTTHHAEKILSREGKENAVAEVEYNPKAGKILEFQAWLITPSGKVKKFGKKETFDGDPGASSLDYVYDDHRTRAIDARSFAEPGTVFGYEASVAEQFILIQDEWPFQERNPVLYSRYSITVPPDWKAQGVMLNGPKIMPSISGSTYTWEMRDLPFIEEEPKSLPVTSLAPRLAISMIGEIPSTLENHAANWPSVSAWVARLVRGTDQPSPELIAKVQQLVAGKTGTFERIQAIGRFVQDIRYAAIERRFAQGGGMIPHPAAEVFAKAYGDCKDKANLLHTMLKVAGIDSYLVSVYSGDRTVRAGGVAVAGPVQSRDSCGQGGQGGRRPRHSGESHVGPFDDRRSDKSVRSRGVRTTS